MKKTLFILIPSLIVAVIVYVIFQAIITRSSEKGALQVTSSPASKVYLNGSYLGQTPLCKCDTQNMILTGDYTVKLVPNDSSLLPFEDKVTITKSVLTVVDRKFGKGVLSEGSIISLTPLSSAKSSQLMVLSFPDKAQVLLDNNDVGTTPLLLSNTTASDHVLELKKDGYKEKIVRIRTPQGFKLQATVYLSVNEAALSPMPTVAVTPSVSPTPALGTVAILTTPTGFLRVHSDASVSSSEIGRVLPGETYPLQQISDDQAWYEIKLKDGTLGWISSQYAEKK